MKDHGLDSRFARYRSRGDLAALGEVFDALAPQLLAIARHLGPAAEAEDLVQTTFLTALEKASDFDSERAVAPWLVGILAHHAANARRRRGRRAEVAPLDALAPSDPRAGDPARVAEAFELDVALDAALVSLPGGYGAALRALLRDGLTPSEIARQLGITPNAARVRVHRGLALLRAALPTGFATGAVVLVAGRGLAETRRVVLEAGAARSAALATGSVSSSGLLGWIAAHRVAFAALLVVTTVTLALAPWPAAPVALPASVQHGSSITLATLAVSDGGPQRAKDLDDAPLAGDDRRATAPPNARFVGQVVTYEAGTAIEGARVWTRDPRSGERVLRSVSDARGRFEFHAERGVEELLVVEAEGFAPSRIPLSEQRRERYWFEACRVERDGGARVDLFEIRLRPGAELRGRVVDGAGWPVAGAELVVLESSGGLLRTVEEHSIGRSGPDGALQLEGRLPWALSDGRHWVLFAIHPSGIGWTRVAAPHGRSTVEDVEVVLDASAPREFGVRDLEGAALEGAIVRLVPLHEPFPGLAGLQHDLLPLPPALADAHSAVVDAGGVARIAAALRADSTSTGGRLGCRYLVEVELDGHVLLREPVATPCGSRERTELRVARSGVRQLVRGRVRGEDGEPLPGAFVRLEGDDGRELDSTHSAADGGFELSVEPGAPLLLAVEARAPGRVVARGSLDRTGPGWNTLPLELVLGEGRSIRGRVVDERGAPVAGVEVYADASHGFRSSPPTDHEGAFEIEGLLAGEYSLTVALDVEGRFEGSSPARARTGESDVRLVLRGRRRAEARIELELVDERDGAPLDAVGAALIPLDGPSPWVRKQLSAGRVVFSELPPGRYEAWVAVAGRASAHVALTAPDGPTVVRERLRFGAAARLTGYVEPRGVAAATRLGVTARLATATGTVPGEAEFSRGGAAFKQAPLGTDGRFELEGLLPGLWRILCSGDGLESDAVELELRSGDDREVSVAVREVAVLELRLERAPGRGFVLLELASEGGDWALIPRVWSGACEGPLTVQANLPDGSIRWRLRVAERPDSDPALDAFAPLEGRESPRAGERVVRQLRFRAP